MTEQSERYLCTQSVICISAAVRNSSSELRLKAAEREKKGIIFFYVFSIVQIYLAVNVAAIKASEVIGGMNVDDH